MRGEHEISYSIQRSGGIAVAAAACRCGKFSTTGPRLSAAYRRKRDRLIKEHFNSVACVQPETHAAE